MIAQSNCIIINNNPVTYSDEALSDVKNVFERIYQNWEQVNFCVECSRLGLSFVHSLDFYPEFALRVIAKLKIPTLFLLGGNFKEAAGNYTHLLADIRCKDCQSLKISSINFFSSISKIVGNADLVLEGTKEIVQFSTPRLLTTLATTFGNLAFFAQFYLDVKKLEDSITLLKRVEQLRVNNFSSVENFVEEQIGFAHDVRMKEQAFIRGSNELAFVQLKQLQIILKSADHLDDSFTETTVDNILKITKQNVHKRTLSIVFNCFTLIAMVFLAFNFWIPGAYILFLANKVLTAAMDVLHSNYLKNLPKPIPLNS